MSNPNQTAANNVEKGLIIAGTTAATAFLTYEMVNGTNIDYNAAQANLVFDGAKLGSARIKLNQDIAMGAPQRTVAIDKSLVEQDKSSLIAQQNAPLEHYTGATQTSLEFGVPSLVLFGSLIYVIGSAIKKRRASSALYS